MKTTDVVIVGGGVMGWCTAYNLMADGFRGSVLLIERDPLRRNTSTSLAVGGFRQQFATEINIRVVRYAVSVYRDFAELMETPNGRPDISMRQNGYLFLASEKTWPAFQRRHELQTRLGIKVSLMTPEQACELVPEMDPTGVVGAAFCPDDGYLDPYSVLQGFEAKARHLGVKCEYAEVIDVEKDGQGVTAVKTKTETIATRTVVNATGAWAGEFARQIGVEVPVRPWRRQVYVCRTPLSGREFPMVVDTTGVHFRSETGNRIVAAGATASDSVTFDVAWDKPAFEDVIWPALANRIPCFDTLLLEKGWGGLYDENPIDHNAIIGRHPDLPGFYLINGFSGHGLMQAPAAGKGLAELIMRNEFRTLDLSDLSPTRFAAGKLIVEEAII
ncbi:MAG: FAD-binding oxidoreductase [Bacillota bacterium]|nr:FAD-binding oxidoreductase [Bacillota bacterium]